MKTAAAAADQRIDIGPVICTMGFASALPRGLAMTGLSAVVLLLTVALMACSARAAPMMPAAPHAPAALIVVKDGCGVGFHRLADGSCRPQPKGPALMRIFARKCPVGYSRNVLGKCRRD